MIIRPTIAADIGALQTILDDTELFPSEMLPDMVSKFLSNPDTPEIWLTCEADGAPAGFCCTAPEELAPGAWNMLAIAVSPKLHNKGFGAGMVAHLEEQLRAAGGRILLADTSGAESFKATRGFYASAGFTEEARIRDYWDAGDDKVVFWKSLKEK